MRVVSAKFLPLAAVLAWGLGAGASLAKDEPAAKSTPAANATAVAQDAQDEPLLGFVAGDYVLVGREPDGGAVYGGAARIEQQGSELVLTRRAGKTQVTARGRIEVPQPPGEGKVLRFHWKQDKPMTMTCLVGGDLDNYARLTCSWLADGSEPKEPGLEAMFPTASWPEDAPDRTFKPSP